MSSLASSVRQCENIKSRKNPDVQCPYTSINGEFCGLHAKHPRRFISKGQTYTGKVYTRASHSAAMRIQKAWKTYSPLLHISQQGLGYYNRGISINDTELCSLEPIATIPNLYYFSLVDSTKSIWSFDIRSLGQILSMGNLKANPYTRAPFPPKTLSKITGRINWLRNRKFSVLFPIGQELTPEQHWKQRILDVCMKIDSFGYNISCDWFSQMSLEDHYTFYKTLHELWNYRLGLGPQEREKIVGGYMSRTRLLFKYSGSMIRDHRNEAKHWWEKLNLYLIESFLTRAVDKEQQKLGAMYCVMAFVAVNDDAAESFPWFSEVLEG